MNAKLMVLIEIEAIKAEIEGMKQNNFIKESKNINPYNDSLFYHSNEFTEKADEIRGLIVKYELDKD